VRREFSKSPSSFRYFARTGRGLAFRVGKFFDRKSFIGVNADFPRLKKNQLSKEQTKLNEGLADKYNPEGKFPLTIIFDETGKVLQEWEGYPHESPEKFVSEINALAHAAY